MKKELILAGLASLMFASCSNDKDLPAVSQGSELGVSTRIFGAGSTRALTDAFVQNNQIGVFVKGTDYVPHLAAYTCPLDPAGTWTSPATDANKIYLANEQATVYAFYPYAASAITNSSNSGQADYYTAVNVTVPSTQQFDGADVADYMYATTREGDGSGTPAYTYPLAKASNAAADDASATPAVYDNKVDLYMHHALSKLSFVVNKDVTYVGTGTLSKLTLGITVPAGTPKFQTGALTMSVSDGVISGAPASDLLTVTGPSDLTINAYNATPSTTVTTAALVAPLADASGITLTLTIDGKAMSVVLPASVANSADKWLAEKNYTYTITVKGSELIVNSVSIVAWGDVAAGNADVQ